MVACAMPIAPPGRPLIRVLRDLCNRGLRRATQAVRRRAAAAARWPPVAAKL